MITSNALQRVFKISYEGFTGTGFACDIDGRQYLVTAAHCINEESAGTVELEILHNEEWHKLPAIIVGSKPHGADIAVLALPQVLVHKDLTLPVAETFYVSQEVFFLGFPHGKHIHIGAMNNDWPMPFIKRGIISGMNNGGKPSVVYLDGINNPGFSGGPVVAQNAQTRTLEVISVVSSYHMVRDQVLSDGIPHPTLEIEVNTGIVETFGVMHVREIARANPIGPLLA